MSYKKTLMKAGITAISRNYKSLKKAPKFIKSTDIGLIKGIYRYNYVQCDVENERVEILAESLISTKNFPPLDTVTENKWHQIELVINRIHESVELYSNGDDFEFIPSDCYMWEKNGHLHLGLYYQVKYPIIIQLNSNNRSIQLYHSYGSFDLNAMVKRFIDAKDKQMSESIVKAEYELAELAYKEIEFWQDEDIRSCFSPQKKDNHK